MAPDPYPNLGFNPVEGLPADVEATTAALAAAGQALGDASSLIDQLADTGGQAWRGSAGDAFRTHFDQTLRTDLRSANSALSDALALLRGWQEDLLSTGESAAGLDREAAAARAALADAAAQCDRATSNPDLGLARGLFAPGAELESAQARLNAATAALDGANANLMRSQDHLDSILCRAHELQAECEAKARAVAAELTEVAARYAPREPDNGFWDNLAGAITAVGDWISDHKAGIHQALTTISSATAVLALVTPPPVDVIALGISVASGVAVLGMDLADPAIREDMGQLLQGNFNKDSLGALGTLGLDALGVLPGAGLAKGLDSGLGIAGNGADLASIVSRTAESGRGVAAAASRVPGMSAAADGLGLVGRHAGSAQYADAAKFLGDSTVAGLSVGSASTEWIH